VLALLVSGCATGDLACPGEYYTPGLFEAAIAAAWDAAICSDPSGSNSDPSRSVNLPEPVSAQQAEVELRESVSAELATIEPLAVPLAPEGIVILPTGDELLHRVKAEAPSGTDDAALVPQVNLLFYNTASELALIKKRGIFENTSFTRSTDLITDVRTEGRYIVLADYREEKREVDWLLLPPGGGEKKWILSVSPLGIGADKTSGFLKEIEDFVKRHEAGTATTG
jgi:hypothetical protein